MKQPGRRLAAEFGAHGPADRVDVLRHVCVVMVGRRGDRVMAVAAHVERDDVEVREKPAPEIDIPVDREPVAVADEEPGRGVHVAVPAHDQHRAIRALDRDFSQKSPAAARSSPVYRPLGVTRPGPDS